MGTTGKRLLAVPQQNRPLTAEEATAAVDRYHAMPEAERIARTIGRRIRRQRRRRSPGLTEDQRRQAADAFEQRQQELADYLADESDAIAEYQHELWRLGAVCRPHPKPTACPSKRSGSQPRRLKHGQPAEPWVAQVDELEQSFLADLRQILTPEQRAEAAHRRRDGQCTDQSRSKRGSTG